MDPLSITASLLAIATLAAQTGAAFHRLRETCNALPGRLLALVNEVADLEAVLREVAHLTHDRRRDLLGKSSYISQLLSQATSKLTELKGLVDKLDKACAQTKIPLVKARAWRKAQSKLLHLQEGIKTIKSSLNVLIGASNSYGSAFYIVLVRILTRLSQERSDAHLSRT
jgi:Fungal N-terminal domain of STAND proteins